MPFPWKKKTSRSSRFSQFVADHINTPVVETGFPTSLVDLFVKNLDRMHKSSKKKRKTPATRHNPVIISSLSSSHAPHAPPLNAPYSIPPPSVSPTKPATNLRIEEETEKSTNFRIEKTIEEGLIGPSANVGGCEKFPESGGFGSLMFVLMIFLVVGLALGTKRFVIGITMSAFLFFFLELVGKNSCFDGIKPESREIQIVKLESRSLAEISSFEKSGNSGDCREESRALPQQISSGEESGNAGDCNEESISFPKEIWSSEESGNSGDCNEGVGCDDKVESKVGVLEKEEENGCEVPEFKHRHSRRARMKAKMKNLVPKKLRKSKKIHSNAESEEVSGSTCELNTCEEREQSNDAELDYQEEQQVLSTEIDHDRHATDSSKESSFVESREVIVEGEMGSQTQCDSGYLVLCLIVLFGLVGGRIVALVLALSWCLILKIIGRSRKVPMVRSSLS